MFFCKQLVFCIAINAIKLNDKCKMAPVANWRHFAKKEKRIQIYICIFFCFYYKNQENRLTRSYFLVNVSGTQHEVTIADY